MARVPEGGGDADNDERLLKQFLAEDMNETDGSQNHSETNESRSSCGHRMPGSSGSLAVAKPEALVVKVERGVASSLLPSARGPPLGGVARAESPGAGRVLRAARSTSSAGSAGRSAIRTTDAADDCDIFDRSFNSQASSPQSRSSAFRTPTKCMTTPAGAASPGSGSSKSGRKSKMNLGSLLEADRFQALGTSQVVKVELEMGSPALELPRGDRREQARTSPAPAGEPCGAHGPPRAAEQEADEVDMGMIGDDKDGDDDAAALPLSELSMNEKIPGGTALAPLSRIRSTLNAKALLVKDMHWLILAKPPTLYAHMRRLQGYEAQIVGKFDIDLEIAFKQMVARLAALLLLHKAARVHSESKKMDELVGVIPPMMVLQKYLQRCKVNFAPDLLTLLAHATFQKVFIDQSSVVVALKTLNFRKLLEWHAKVKETPVPDPDEEHDGDDGQETKRPAFLKGKKKRRTLWSNIYHMAIA